MKKEVRISKKANDFFGTHTVYQDALWEAVSHAEELKKGEYRIVKCFDKAFFVTRSFPRYNDRIVWILDEDFFFAVIEKKVYGMLRRERMKKLFKGKG